MKWIIFLLFFISFTSWELFSRNLPGEGSIAVIRIYNPTKTDKPCVVEVPAGNLATQDLINWQNVQLLSKGEFIPFALREGRAHWRAELRSPIIKPQAEDLLVFQISVPAGQWANVELVPGVSKQREALTRKDGFVVITHPDMKVIINEHTGLITDLEAFGESLLSYPFGLQFFEVGEGVVKHEGSMSSGYHRPVVTVKKTKELALPVANLVSWSSNEALTELNFVMKPEKGPSISLTYRIYPNNEIVIVSDERPWQGRSPWLDCGLEYNLVLAGTKEELPGFQTHFPYFGFKDYAASVKSTGTLHHGTKTFMFELGEQSVNGRFWRRRLAVYPETEWKQYESLLELLDEGLVVDVLPMSSQPLSDNINVVCPEEYKEIGGLLVERLNKTGIQAKSASQFPNDLQSSIVLKIIQNPQSTVIQGDGFCIRPLPDKKGIEVTAGTKMGLFKGTLDITKYIKKTGDKVTVPLVAGNPVVDLRASGLGGSNVETDFTHESDAEWENALNDMIGSGMNTITDLGMWSNWQMPVSFKYMPELKSDSRDEYDEVSGTRFSEIADQREHGLKLLKFLHARGVRVWLWIPVGAIPTTFQKRFPEATVPGNSKTPRFMHQKYRQYLNAYFKELLEVYPVDGFVLIRDDNGGIDETLEFKSFIDQSITKSAVWEQYLSLYDLLRSMDFKGQIAVYPYFDSYEPGLETLLPEDLLVLGHGSGMGVLTHHFDKSGFMGDTWLDNLYVNFRVPPSGRMKRLLSDRGSYWLGGAYCGTELPWEAIGYFGWQPTASVNSLRYEFGERTFGEANGGVSFVAFSNAYEQLWEIMNDWLLPQRWVTASENERSKIIQESMHWFTTYNKELITLKEGCDQKTHAKWFAHIDLYETFFNYCLGRAELVRKIEALTFTNRQTVNAGNSLSEPLRLQLIAMNDEINSLTRHYYEQASKVPGNMMAQTCANRQTVPSEWVSGYDRSLDNFLQIKQFDGLLSISTNQQMKAGQPFELKIELQNRGFMPWASGAGHEIRLQGETSLPGLPDRWIYEGAPMVFGDRRIITLRGMVPSQPGETQIKIDFLAPFGASPSFLSQTIKLKW